MASLLLGVPASGEEFLWDINFKTIFDNREGESKVADAKTFFLTQLSPQIGISLAGGEHTVMGGIVWTQPIGCEWDGYRLSPTVYYRYSKNGLKGFLGMFPRESLFRDVPDFIWNDSTYYVQRNIRGAAIVNSGEKGFIQALLDWRGMQNKKQREAFNIIAMGEWRRNSASLWSLGGLLMVNHLALREDPPPGEGVVDNIVYNPYVAFDLHRLANKMDSLRISIGALGTLTRDREGENKWKTPLGLWIDASFRWKWLGVREELYIGGKLFPYYQKFGATLYQGEPYFSSDFYSRTELQGYIIDKKFVTLKASLDFHATSTDFIFYQRLILKINFDGSFNKRKT